MSMSRNNHGYLLCLISMRKVILTSTTNRCEKFYIYFKYAIHLNVPSKLCRFIGHRDYYDSYTKDKEIEMQFIMKHNNCAWISKKLSKAQTTMDELCQIGDLFLMLLSIVLKLLHP